MKLNRALISLVLALIILLGTIRLWLRLLISGPSTLFIDFGVYYQAAEYALDGQNLFAADYTNIPNTGSRWLYLPILVTVFIPFVILPYTLAGTLWIVVTSAVLVIAIIWLVEQLFSELSLCEKLVIGIAVLSFPPILSALFLGQVTPLITALMCVYAGSLVRESESKYLTGSTAAIASLIKPTYLPIGAPLLYSKKRLASSFITGLIILMAGLVVFGIGTHVEYLEVLQNGKGWGTEAHLVPRDWRVTTYMPWYYLYPYHLIANALIILVTLVVTLLAYTKQNRRTELYVLTLGLFAVPLATPSPGILDLSTTVPGILIVTYLEQDYEGDASIVPLYGTGLITVHPFVIEFLVGDLTRQISILRNITEILVPALPAIAPAVWGSITLFIFTLWRLVQTLSNSV